MNSRRISGIALMSALLGMSALAFAFALSESPSVEWYGTYGGLDSERMHQGHRSVIETGDGGYAIVGRTYSYGSGGDFYLVKTDASGNMQWNRTYGRSHDDVAESVIQTSDGGYAIAGASWNISRSAHDLLLVKTDANGNMEWNLTYIRDDSGGSLDWGHAACVIQTTDEGYMLSASVRHHPDHPTSDWDGWLVKTDANGTVEWDRPYGGDADDGAHTVLQTIDGGYTFAGTTLSYGAGSGDAWLVKTDASGNQEWMRTFGGSSWDDGWTVSKTLDGGYIIGGTTGSFGAGNKDFWLVKTNASGHEEWSESYGGVDEDYGWSVIETDNGGYALAGYSRSFGAGGNDCWLVVTDSLGNQKWNKTLGGAGNDEARSVIQSTDGGYVIGGFSDSLGGSSDLLLIKLAPREVLQTMLFFNIKPDPAVPGQTITFKGVLIDDETNPLGHETVELYAHSFGGPWRYITSIVTDGCGIFTWQTTIPLTMPPNLYIFAVYYPGSESYESSYNFATLIIE